MAEALTVASSSLSHMGVSQNFGGPNSKDYSILGSILGSPYFGKLPYQRQLSQGRQAFAEQSSSVEERQACGLLALSHFTLKTRGQMVCMQWDP